jgi:serine/threonine-protein kinase PpkA
MSRVAFTHPDYTIIKELGRGGSAAVYLCVQKSLNRRVAIKVLHGLAADPVSGMRFLREGRIIAKLNHPHIVLVYDVGTSPQDASTYFMTMEYLPGGTLTEQSPDFSLAELFTTIEQICAALAYAHDQGFVHRDVKPDNILFRKPGEALLADFGIARAATSQTHMTMTGAMLGTPDYMSPEQVTGAEIDHRSDLYSLGVVLFEMLSGYKPLQGDSVVSTGLQHLAAAPLPLPENVKHFQPLIDRLLAKKPEERVNSASELAQQLQKLVSQWSVALEQPLADIHTGETPHRVPIETTLTSVKPSSSNLPWVAGGAIAAVAVASTFFFLNNDKSETTPPLTQQALVAPAPAPTELELTMDAALEAFRLDRWFGDQPDNAAALFQKALTLDPNNADARRMLSELFNTTANRTNSAIEANDFDRADRLVAELHSTWPDDERVNTLQTSLDNARIQAATQQQVLANNAEISTLMAEAGRSITRGALIKPDDASAAYYYQQVLSKDPNNVLAASGIANIVNQLINQADRALTQKDFSLVESTLADIRTITPDDSRAEDLEQRLTKERTETRLAMAQQEEQKRLSQDIEALASRIDAWVVDENSSLNEVYEDLSSDMANLLAAAPENPELRSLQSVAQRHADRLNAVADSKQEEDEEDNDGDRFRFGSF